LLLRKVLLPLKPLLLLVLLVPKVLLVLLLWLLLLVLLLLPPLCPRRLPPIRKLRRHLNAQSAEFVP
jgi:hypothetical protein